MAAWCEMERGRGKTRDGGWPESTGLPVFVRRSALLFHTELDRKVETSPKRCLNVLNCWTGIPMAITD